MTVDSRLAGWQSLACDSRRANGALDAIRAAVSLADPGRLASRIARRRLCLLAPELAPLERVLGAGHRFRARANDSRATLRRPERRCVHGGFSAPRRG